MGTATVLRDMDSATVQEQQGSVSAAGGSSSVTVGDASDQATAADGGGSVSVEDGGTSVSVSGGSGGSTGNYNTLGGKPRIEGVELIGDKMLSEFGLSGGDNVEVDHGLITVDELTAAQTAALLTDD